MTAADFLTTLDNSMAMKSGEWLEEQMLKSQPVILDLRGSAAWDKSHLKGSLPLSLNDLPDEAEQLIPSKESVVICLCNGSVQSAMAVMYLRTEGYTDSYNLSGGFSSWQRNERPLEGPAQS